MVIFKRTAIFLTSYRKSLPLIQINKKGYSHSVNEDLLVNELKGDFNGVTVLGFNRPQQKNAFSVNLVRRLHDELNRISSNSNSRILILRSAVPGIFCAGADLKERISMSPDQVSQFVTNLRNLMNRLHNLTIPVIAAIDGVALGGGLEISLACDIRVSSAEAKLGLVETKLAIIPGAGGTQQLPRLIGPSLAKELIFTAKVFDGIKAHELGIVNHVVQQNNENDAAYQKSLEIAGEILPNGPIAIRMAKAAINRGVQVDLSTGLAIEEACYAQVISTNDRLEGLQAFKEKRKPQYQGK